MLKHGERLEKSDLQTKSVQSQSENKQLLMVAAIVPGDNGERQRGLRREGSDS